MIGPPLRDALGREVTPERIAALQRHLELSNYSRAREARAREARAREARLILDALTAENERLEGWGQNTMDGCLGILVKVQTAFEAALTALGSGPGSSELLEELYETVRQLSAGHAR